MRRLLDRRLVSALFFGSCCATSALATTPARAEPVRTLDLRALFGAAPTDVAARRDAYDTLVAAACIQGLANRSGPNLYLFYVHGAVDASIDTDALWLERLADPKIGAHLLDGRKTTPVDSVEDAIDAYGSLVKGLVVWDEKVPATVNAAFVAAGADDLIAVRWDASPTSLFAKLKAKHAVKVWLVNQDGTSRFLDDQGQGKVPDTDRQTSQSAKADAYVWALENYLKATPTRVDPTEYGWMLDARWVTTPTDYAGNINPTGQLQISNHDWLVMKRGVPFDLSPWSDVGATDAPGQAPGTDPAIIKELLAAGRANAGDQSITIRGFFAWQFKYTNLEGLSAGHEPVQGEWTSVKLVSPYGAGLDADAPGIATMANASFFSHVPLEELPEPQRRPTPEDLVGQGFLHGLADNGGFEDGEAGWSVGTANHVVYTDPAAGPASARTGLHFLECNTDQVGDPAHDALTRDGPAVGAGERVTLRAFVRAPVGTVHGSIELHALGGTEETKTAPFVAKAGWSEVKVSLDVANAGHTMTRSLIRLADAGPNLDVDDVAFYAGDAAAAPVVAANYVLWFVGDYDAAAWIESFTPVVWDAPGRGLVPFAWDFSGHVASRFPPFFRHALASRTSRDFFVSADSGPGYGNPSEMDDATRAIWTKAGVRDARVLDSAAGWILNPLDGIDAAHLAATTPYDGDGVLLLGGAGSVATPSLVDHAPVVALTGLGGTTPAEASAFIRGATPATPGAPTFSSFRAVLWKSTDLVATTHDLVENHPGSRYRFVDPFTFFELSRRDLGGDNAHRASFKDLTITGATDGHAPHVKVTVRNDGWETWRAAAPNNYRVGFDVRGAPAAPRALPADAKAYPTRVALKKDVPPGGEVVVEADLPAQKGGKASLQMDVVEEGATWFESAGDIPALVTMVVKPASSGAGGSGGAGGDSGAGAGHGQGAGAGGGGGHASSDDGGCGCEAAGRGRGSSVAWLLLTAIPILRRFRSRRPVRAGRGIRI